VTAPLVSIGLPVYNGERFLPQAIESLLGQTFGDFELLVCDNASTDGTVDMVRDYMRADDRIRLHPSEVNRGLAWNWNRAVPLARGRYFKWAAADDVHLPEYLARTVQLLETDRTAVLAHSHSADIDENGTPFRLVPSEPAMDARTPHERFHALTRRGWACIPLFGVIRADVIRRTGLHGAYPRSDRTLLAELGLYGRLVEVDEVLFHHREFGGRVTRATDLRTRYPIFTGGEVPDAPLPHWDLLAGFVTAVRRAPLPPREKARCLAQLYDYTWEGKRALLGDLRRRAQFLLTHRIPEPPVPEKVDS
jgi:glycosyltransferase involved in cell wall biosynthesis